MNFIEEGRNRIFVKFRLYMYNKRRLFKYVKREGNVFSYVKWQMPCLLQKKFSRVERACKVVVTVVFLKGACTWSVL